MSVILVRYDNNMCVLPYVGNLIRYDINIYGLSHVSNLSYIVNKIMLWFLSMSYSTSCLTSFSSAGSSFVGSFAASPGSWLSLGSLEIGLRSVAPSSTSASFHGPWLPSIVSQLQDSVACDSVYNLVTLTCGCKVRL